VITNFVLSSKVFKIFVKLSVLIKGVSAKQTKIKPSKFCNEVVAFLTASPVPHGCFWMTVLFVLDISLKSLLFSGITIILFWIPAVSAASITQSIIGLPEIVCNGLAVSECILLPLPALNIIEQISIKMLYLLKL
jgi:hypothetical protein